MDERRSDEPGRRGEDKRFANLQAQIATTRQSINALRDTVEDLQDELKTFDASIYGGQRDKDSVSFRLKSVENMTQELYRVVIGDEGGNGGLRKLVQGISFELKEFHAQIDRLAESKRDRVTRWSAVITAGLTSLALVFTNLDKIALGTEKFVEVFRHDKVMDPDRIKSQIEQMRKTRGPEIEKKLKEIERAARGR